MIGCANVFAVWIFVSARSRFSGQPVDRRAPVSQVEQIVGEEKVQDKVADFIAERVKSQC